MKQFFLGVFLLFHFSNYAQSDIALATICDCAKYNIEFDELYPKELIIKEKIKQVKAYTKPTHAVPKNKTIKTLRVGKKLPDEYAENTFFFNEKGLKTSEIRYGQFFFYQKEYEYDLKDSVIVCREYTLDSFGNKLNSAGAHFSFDYIYNDQQQLIKKIKYSDLFPKNTPDSLLDYQTYIYHKDSTEIIYHNYFANFLNPQQSFHTFNKEVTISSHHQKIQKYYRSGISPYFDKPQINYSFQSCDTTLFNKDKQAIKSINYYNSPAPMIHILATQWQYDEQKRLHYVHKQLKAGFSSCSDKDGLELFYYYLPNGLPEKIIYKHDEFECITRFEYTNY